MQSGLGLSGVEIESQGPIQHDINDAQSGLSGQPRFVQQDPHESSPDVRESIENGRLGLASPHSGTGNALTASLSNPVPGPELAWPGGAQMDYPDVSSYAPQNIYQQTDPSIYNSPWPPVSLSGEHRGSSVSYPADMAHAANMHFTAMGQAISNFSDRNDLIYNGFESTAMLQDALSGHRNLPVDVSTEVNIDDGSMQLKLQSLPILENLATRLIATIAAASYSTLQDIIQGTESNSSQAYNALKSLFDQTRKVYSRETAFIDAIAIQMLRPAQQEVIRKANIATFVSSVLGAHDVSFYHLNEFYLETFVPLGHRLLKWQGALYLELKTQAYISALINSDSDPELMLDEIFPSDLAAHILSRHPDAPTLSPSEQDFIDRSRARKNYLNAEPQTETARRDLPKKYQWSDFVREFASCISKNADTIMSVPVRHANAASASVATERLNTRSPYGGQHDQTAFSIPSGSNASVHQRDGAEIPKKSSAPTSTVRQAWTKAEEDALVSGLEKVNGPHWSQILALYGRGGSESEVLKDRNQVQLKDKARNLKLWYLKMGREVPVALRGVTGELRKRGGARARAALAMMGEDTSHKTSDGLTDPETDDGSRAGTPTAGRRGER